jgi:hypothetical protein
LPASETEGQVSSWIFFSTSFKSQSRLQNFPCRYLRMLLYLWTTQNVVCVFVE